MTDIEKSQMRGMRNDGYTLQQIGDTFGCSREYVRQCLGNRSYSGTLKRTVEQIPFIGLRNWIDENKISVAELCEKMGLSEANGSQTYLTTYIYGKHEFRKSHIDKLIEITNIPYEELFRME